MNDSLTHLTHEALIALTFDDLPASTETAGKGIHLGKRFRTIETIASDKHGAMHRYRLTITRFNTPSDQAKAKWEAAEKKLLALQQQDTERLKNLQGYYERLSKAYDKAEQLRTEWRTAERQQKEPSPDKVNLKDLGRTEAQIESDRAIRMAAVLGRPSARFLDYLLEGSQVTPNESQRELLADFFEGKRPQAPFYFMGNQWLPVLEKACAITYLPDGQQQASGEKLLQAYHTFTSNMQRQAG